MPLVLKNGREAVAMIDSSITLKGETEMKRAVGQGGARAVLWALLTTRLTWSRRKPVVKLPL
jgi:hypothetical protein